MQQSSVFMFIWVHNPTVALANVDSISLVLLYIQFNYRLVACTGNSECTQMGGKVALVAVKEPERRGAPK